MKAALPEWADTYITMTVSLLIRRIIMIFYSLDNMLHTILYDEKEEYYITTINNIAYKSKSLEELAICIRNIGGIFIL